MELTSFDYRSVGGHSRTSGSAVMSLLPALLLLFGFFWLPLMGTVLDSLRSSDGWSLAAYGQLADDAFPKILIATVLDSAIVTAACVVLGLPVAYTLARLESRWVSVLLVAVTVPLFVSSLIRSYSWVAILGNRGLVNQAMLWLGLTERPIKLAYTQAGMIAAMVQVQLPLFILPAYSVMRRIDPRIRRAAQSLGADPITAFITTFLPLALPGIAVSALLVFIGSLGFFETPALLGPPGAYLISQSIEVRINSLGDHAGAAAQAIVLLIITFLLLILAIAPARRSLGLGGNTSRKIGWRRPWQMRLLTDLEAVMRWLSPWRWIIAGPAVAAVLFLAVAPLVILIPLAFSAAPYLTFPPSSLSFRWFGGLVASGEWIDGMIFSAELAFGAGLMATVAGGLAVLSFAQLPARLRLAVMFAGTAPLIVSPMVLAVSVFYIAAWLGLLGTPMAFIGTYALMGLPYPLLIIAAAFLKLDPALQRAATSLGARPVVVLRTVTIPLLSAAVLSSFLFAFVVAFNDLSVSLFLSSSTMRTLPLLMWDELRQEITPRLAAVAVVVLGAGGLLCWAVNVLRSGLARRRHRRLARMIGMTALAEQNRT